MLIVSHKLVIAIFGHPKVPIPKTRGEEGYIHGGDCDDLTSVNREDSV